MSRSAETGLAVRSVVAETVTAEAFAPFGSLLAPAERHRLPNRTYGDDIVSFKPAPIEAERPLEWLLSVLKARELRVNFLERHLELGQAFIPLGGNPFISVVAAPECRLEHDLPALDDVRAFIVPGDIAIQLHRGTWHEPPFALVDGSSVLMTSHRDLTEGLAQPLDARNEIRHLDVDKRNVTERTGVVLRVTLP